MATNDLRNVSSDTITFAGEQQLMLEGPLQEVVRRLPRIPPFDISIATGYSAAWEVIDSRLHLMSFSATTNHQPFLITSVFPGRNLPICADWYSGTIHIVELQTMISKMFGRGPYTYGRVIALEVIKGRVVATNELHNVSEEKLKR